ncbi:MAG: hypothetical protein ACM3MG_02845, partial [Bacillota bacterium]
MRSSSILGKPKTELPARFYKLIGLSAMGIPSVFFNSAHDARNSAFTGRTYFVPYLSLPFRGEFEFAQNLVDP